MRPLTKEKIMENTQETTSKKFNLKKVALLAGGAIAALAAAKVAQTKLSAGESDSE
jgi:hypothetical protein